MPQSASETSRKPAGLWIFDARTDLLYVANLYWPLLLIPSLVVTDRQGPLDFLQTYFLSTPHRWITLFLVLADSSRRGKNTLKMVWLAVAMAIGIGIVHGRFGYLICLLWLDFVWNAWHFAAQHAGVLAIYARKSGHVLPNAVKWSMRLTLTTVIVMVPMDNYMSSDLGKSFALMAAGGMLAMSFLYLQSRVRHSIPANCYFLSVFGLYGGIFCCGMASLHTASNALFFGASLFHAVEYLAVVSRYVISKESAGAFITGLPRTLPWNFRLGGYLLGCGSALMYIQSNWPELSAAVNLWAAFLHYAFDGWIWKLRDPATAKMVTANPVTVSLGGKPVAVVVPN